MEYPSCKDILVENPKFDQNVVTFHIIGVDRSGSMAGKEKPVKDGFKIIKETLSKLEDPDSSRVCKIEFGDKVYPSDLKCIDNFNTRYSACNEGTALYAVICYVRDQVAKLNEEYGSKYRLNINFVMLSDGEDWSNWSSFYTAQAAVKELKEKFKTSTLFYAIGKTQSEVKHVAAIARELGFEVCEVGGTASEIIQASRQLSHKLETSSRTGKPITMQTSGLSQVAAANFAGYAESVQEVFDDPFEDLFN